MTAHAWVEHRCRTCERGKPLKVTERTTYRKMMNGHAGVKHGCRTCERGKPLKVTQRTTYSKMDE